MRALHSSKLGLVALLVISARFVGAQDGGVTWRSLPAGQFVLGCADEKKTAAKPAPTRMPALWVMPRRVSVAEYRSCVDAAVCSPAGRSPWCDVSSPEGPATCVSFPQAQAFCAWAGGRLPTDTEWEYASDLGMDMNAGPRVDDKHGATEWVTASPRRRTGYEGTRGGTGDLEPLLRCDRGDANVEGQHGSLGFRCARTTRPSSQTPPFPRAPPAAKGELIRFTSTATGLALEKPLSAEAHRQTFVVCRDEVAPLGAMEGEVTVRVGHEESGGRVEQKRPVYRAPCEVSFLVRGLDLRPGLFRPIATGGPFGDARVTAGKDAGCVLVRGSHRQELRGAFGKCEVQFAGDLNDDGVTDLMVHHMPEDPCLTATLLLSADAGWVTAADGLSFCPD